MSGFPRTWVLLGNRRGDNNQLLALAEGLGIPFETRTLAYKRTARPIMQLVPRSILHLTSASRAHLAPPWPDLVIGIGRRSVPIARWIKDQSGGRTKIIRVGHPRSPNPLFDLVLTTHQYPVADGDNVVKLPLAMNRFRASPPPTEAERSFLDALPRPHILLSLGGTAPMWRLDEGKLADAVATLRARARDQGGTLLVIGSPRTPDTTTLRIRSAIDGASDAWFVDGILRYAVALADADEHAVTADSVSMISEAIQTGKPVGLIAVTRSTRGRLRLGETPDRNALRDPRRFWSYVEEAGLAGPVDRPVAGEVGDPVAIAVAAVRERLGDLFDQRDMHS